MLSAGRETGFCLRRKTGKEKAMRTHVDRSYGTRQDHSTYKPHTIIVKEAWSHDKSEVDGGEHAGWRVWKEANQA